MTRILDAASGRWPELLQALAGLSDAQLTDRHQPCPACGGTDRYRWDCDDGPGGWFCNQCGGKDHRGGAGSGVDLLMRVRGWSLTDACRAVAQHLGLEQPIPDPPVAGARWWRYTPTVVVRRLPPKDIRPLTWDGSSWRLKAPPSPRPLYWPRRRAGRPILVVEGEPAADAAAALFPDHAVCTWMSGCKAVHLADWQPLARQEVILWPDADDVGAQAMQRLAGILHGLGAAVSVVMPPEGVPKGWDLADADWTPEQAARELVDRATPWEPPAAAAEPGEPESEHPGQPAEPLQLSYRDLLSATLDAVRQDDEDAEMALRAEIMTRFRRNDGQITAALFRLLAAQSKDGPTERPTYRSIDLRQVEGLDWLLEGFIPDRDQALLYAPAGAGKTTAALGMAFAVIDQTGFLDHDTHASGGNVLLIASDSGPAPVVRALADMGRGDDPALSPSTTGHRLHCWAHDPSQGAMAWEASLRGCLALLRFVQEEQISLVVIDSCKAVTSKCDLNYCDNGQVTALLTWCQEVLCRHASVLWINHEGTGEGTAAGAKAWKEVPSIVHSIELVPAGPKDDSKPRRGGGRQGRTSTLLRAWKVRKCRQGTAREFLYQVDTLTGRLGVATGVELKRDCRAHIVEVLTAALNNGVTSLHRRALAEELGARFGYSWGTVSNGLTRVTGGRDPEVVRVGSLPGHYRLSDHWLEVARRAGTGVSG